jgi:hypothetical protein
MSLKPCLVAKMTLVSQLQIDIEEMTDDEPLGYEHIEL